MAHKEWSNGFFSYDSVRLHSNTTQEEREGLLVAKERNMHTYILREDWGRVEEKNKREEEGGGGWRVCDIKVDEPPLLSLSTHTYRHNSTGAQNREWKWTATRKQVHCSVVYFWSPVPSSSPTSCLPNHRSLFDSCSLFTRLLLLFTVSFFPASSPLLPLFSPFFPFYLLLKSVRSERANDSSPMNVWLKSSHFTVSYWKKNFSSHSLSLFFCSTLHDCRQAYIQTNIKITSWTETKIRITITASPS